MKIITATTEDMARTFTLIARPDTHHFIEHDLPEFQKSLAVTTVPLRSYLSSLRSGEYIPKSAYADAETDYVYLTIGQFSGAQVVFDDLTFLDPVVVEKYVHLAVQPESLVITRSGTVGVVHVFRPPDTKVYIPSHHLAIAQIPDDGEHSIEYVRLYLQSEFARKYFWAFASGKGQKEISNWSIKSIPIPQASEPHEVATEVLKIEAEIEALRAEVAAKSSEKQRALLDAIR